MDQLSSRRLVPTARYPFCSHAYKSSPRRAYAPIRYSTLIPITVAQPAFTFFAIHVYIFLQ